MACNKLLRLFHGIAIAGVLGLVTGFGLDFLAGRLSGPRADRATLQLVGMLCASTLVPGHARGIGGFAAETTLNHNCCTKSKNSSIKEATCSAFNNALEMEQRGAKYEGRFAIAEQRQ
eukprot:402044-Amphidinium_carterae.1